MKLFLPLVFFFCSISAFSQRSDFSWLEGTWSGPGFGGTFEEIWSSPNAKGEVIGMFRFTDSKGDVQFMEFWILTQEGMKLKHFNPDFTGWEEKDDFMTFEMVKAEPNKIVMQGLIYELASDGTLKIELKLKEKEEVRTEHFQLTKSN